jgi:hypothetical protein
MECSRYRFVHWNYKYPARTEWRDLNFPGKVWEQRIAKKKNDSNSCHELERFGIVEPVMSWSLYLVLYLCGKL